MRIFALALCALIACDEPAAPEEASETVETPPAEPEEAAPGTHGREPEGDDPLAGLDDPESIEDADGALAPPTRVPNGACAAFSGEATRVWARPGIAEIVAAEGDGFALAGYADTEEGEELFLVSVRPGASARPLYRSELERPLRTPRTAAPGLARLEDGSFGVAATDLGARLLFTRIHPAGRQTPLRSLDNGTDQRFSPSVVAAEGGAFVAFTDGSESRSRVRVVVTDASGDGSARFDATPAAGSAQAPTFLSSSRLAVLDPREGTSTLWSMSVSASGVGSPEVIQPLTNLYDPVSLTLVEGEARISVAYTAVGQAARTAVGFVAAAGMPPRALVPSAGYGALSVDSTASENSVVYAAMRSTAETREAPREAVVLRAPRNAPGEWGEPLVFEAPMRIPRVAHNGGDYALAYGREDGVYVRFFRCDES